MRKHNEWQPFLVERGHQHEHSEPPSAVASVSNLPMIVQVSARPVAAISNRWKKGEKIYQIHPEYVDMLGGNYVDDYFVCTHQGRLLDEEEAEAFKRLDRYIERSEKTSKERRSDHA